MHDNLLDPAIQALLIPRFGNTVSDRLTGELNHALIFAPLCSALQPLVLEP